MPKTSHCPSCGVEINESEVVRELAALRGELETTKAARDGWKASFGHENARYQQACRACDEWIARSRALLDALKEIRESYDPHKMAYEIADSAIANASEQETRKEVESCAMNQPATEDAPAETRSASTSGDSSKVGSGDVPSVPQPAEATPETGLQDSNTLEPMPESCAACEACHGLSSASMIRNPAKWFVTLAFASKLERQRNYWKRHYYEKEKPTRALAEQLAAERTARAEAEKNAASWERQWDRLVAESADYNAKWQAAEARLAHHQATFEYIAGYLKGLPDQRWARYMAKRQKELEAMP